MTVLNPEYFVGELTVAQAVSEFAASNSLQWFIDKYEPLFYKATIGLTNYQQMLEEAKTSEQKTAPYAAMFVYYHYMLDLTIPTPANEEFNILLKKSTAGAIKRKLVMIWNEIVDNIYCLPEQDKELFEKLELGKYKNYFGI